MALSDLGDRAVAVVRAAGRPIAAARNFVDASTFGQPGPEMSVPDLRPGDYSPATAAVNVGLRILAEARSRANYREKQKSAALDAEYKRAQIDRLRAQSVPEAKDPTYSLEVPGRALPGGQEGPPAPETVGGLTGNQYLTQGRELGLFSGPPKPEGDYDSIMFPGRKVSHAERLAEMSQNRADKGLLLRERNTERLERESATKGEELNFSPQDRQTLTSAWAGEREMWNRTFDERDPGYMAARDNRVQTQKRLYMAYVPRYTGRMGALARTILASPDVKLDQELLKAVDAAIPRGSPEANDPNVIALLQPLYGGQAPPR